MKPNFLIVGALAMATALPALATTHRPPVGVEAKGMDRPAASAERAKADDA